MTKVLCFILLAVTCVSAKLASYTKCSNEEICDVTEVRIEPCLQAPKPCRLKKGTDTTISFEYIPQFNATRAEMAVYWANGGVEPAFSELDNEACKYTTCGLEIGKTNVLNYKLHLSKKLPTGNFPIKWKLWNENDRAEVCCFITQITLRR